MHTTVFLGAFLRTCVIVVLLILCRCVIGFHVSPVLSYPLQRTLYRVPLYWTIFLLRKCIPPLIKIGCCGSSSICCFPLSQIKVVSFVLLLLSDVLGVEVFSHRLRPVAMVMVHISVCYCRLRLHVFAVPWKHLTNFLKASFFSPFFVWTLFKH